MTTAIAALVVILFVAWLTHQILVDVAAAGRPAAARLSHINLAQFFLILIPTYSRGDGKIQMNKDFMPTN